MLSNLHRVSNMALLLVAMFLPQPGLIMIEAQTCPAPSDENQQCYCPNYMKIKHLDNLSYVQTGTAGDDITVSCNRTLQCNLEDYWVIQIGNISETVRQGRPTVISGVTLEPDNSSSMCPLISVENYTYSLRIRNVTTEMDGSIITCGVRYIYTMSPGSSPCTQYWYHSHSILLRVGPAITNIVTEKGCLNTDIRPVGELVKDVQDGGNVTVTCESTCGADSEKLWLVQMGNNLIALHNETERLAFREEYELDISMDHDDINSNLTLESVRTNLDNLVIRCGQTINSTEGYTQAYYSQYTVVLNLTESEPVISFQKQIQIFSQQLENCSQDLSGVKEIICHEEILTVAVIMAILSFTHIMFIVVVVLLYIKRKCWKHPPNDVNPVNYDVIVSVTPRVI